jgi:dCMP deaminase
MFNNKRIDWDKYFLFLCKIIASRSTCLSKKYGAVIVKDKRILSTGYNGASIGEKHCIDKGYCNKRENEKNIGVRKNCYAVHAEINAIVSAAKNGTSIDGTTLYVSVQPCFECLKIILNSEIKRIVVGGIYSGNIKNSEYISKNIELIKFTEDDEKEMLKYFMLPFEHKLID